MDKIPITYFLAGSLQYILNSFIVFHVWLRPTIKKNKFQKKINLIFKKRLSLCFGATVILKGKNRVMEKWWEVLKNVAMKKLLEKQHK